MRRPCEQTIANVVAEQCRTGRQLRAEHLRRLAAAAAEIDSKQRLSRSQQLDHPRDGTPVLPLLRSVDRVELVLRHGSVGFRYADGLGRPEVYVSLTQAAFGLQLAEHVDDAVPRT